MPGNFESLALEAFQLQYSHNPVYRQYVDAIGRDPQTVVNSSQIPFLPINFFKSHSIKTGDFEVETIFESSGTTGSINSRHYIKDVSLYRASFTKNFELFYGPISEYCIIGLLPSYLEREHSSLVHMVNEMIHISGHRNSGFYLHDHEDLYKVLLSLENAGQKTLLIGVSFGLLDFSEKYQLPLRHTIVMETGGMKGRRKELVRAELHAILKQAFQLPEIHSEYGMTELLSQAYSKGGGIFQSAPWMKILIRDEDDPFTVRAHNTDFPISGTINVIDLANIHSCCFIATDDAGKLYPDESFEVIGRVDNSDLRGCSLMLV